MRGLGVLVGADRARMVTATLSDLSSLLSYNVLPAGRRSRQELLRLRERHRGERCFILGNGPSLAGMDLRPLQDEVTFGLNRAYLMFDRLGFSTTYLVSVNRLVIEQCADDLTSLDVPTFLAWHSRRYVRGQNEHIFLRTVRRPGFAHAAESGIWEGATVTYVALQLAYHMGFQTVVLVGVDHSFVTTGEPHREVVSTGDDPNHFDPSYFGRGFRWNLPDLATSEVAYKAARQAFAASGRRVIDATVNGKLQVFPKANYGDLVGITARQ
jgi:hypothetical protein